MQAIRDEFELSTGKKLADFQDKRDIKWGEDWRKVIEDNLLSTTFFIPILTPAYFRRPNCLSELRAAVHLPAQNNGEIGICPIMYIDCTEEVESLADDELATYLGRHQWKYFADVRRSGVNDERYRQRVGEIVDELIAQEKKLDEANSGAIERIIGENMRPIDDGEGIFDRIRPLHQ